MSTHPQRFTVRPLAALPRHRAHQLVTHLYSPGQRFARAFYTYWRDVLGQSIDEAERNTSDELAASARAILGNLADRNMFAVEIDRIPAGIFGLRPLTDHPQARALDAACDRHLYLYPGRRAVAHAVALSDAHASPAALKTVFALIADRALADGYDHILFFSSDHRLARLYRRFGFEFPDHLRLPDSEHLAGVFHLTRPENLVRLRRVATAVGLTLAGSHTARAA